MLDAFEARLADLIADELSGEPALQLVTRPRGDLAAALPDPERVAIVVHTISANADHTMGDDARERRGRTGQFQLRTVLRLRGEVAADAAINTGGGTEPERRRLILVRVLDRLLVAMQRDEVRSGRAFRTDVDQGFELEGFRLTRLGEPGEAAAALGLPAGFAAIRATYDFAGRFWPVEAPVEGDVIAALPTRIAMLPALIPDRLRAVAGGPDLSIPVGLDLRVMNGATPRVMARLKGASPPGELLGDTTGVPPSWVAYTPESSGFVTVVYRPPAALTSPARVRVSMALSRDVLPPVPLTEFAIEVSGQ